MLLRKIMPYVACLAVGGCSTTGTMLKDEKPLSEFPAGYICTNISLPYMQAAYGVLSGSITTIEPDDPLIFLFRPPENECDFYNAQITAFAKETDTDQNKILTYKEVKKGLHHLKKK